MNTYQDVEITVKNDDEGFLGNDPDAIAKINVNKSVNNYEAELRAALAEAFPGATITLEYAPYSGKSVIVSSDPQRGYEIDEGEISDEVSEIVGRIYDRGTFWDYK
jgi:hypothetical protein